MSERGGRGSKGAPLRALARARFEHTREETVALCAPLELGDYEAQSMPDASPVKWHLAHTTWFYDVFVLEPWEPRYAPHHPSYKVLFNSYYNAVSERQVRAERGLLTRPTLSEVQTYRRCVEERVLALLASLSPGTPTCDAVCQRVLLGTHHEQQHQELMLTDLLHLFSRNPLEPSYRERLETSPLPNAPLSYSAREGGLEWVGHDARSPAFAFDNECPRHQVFVHPFEIANRAVTNAEFADFIRDRGYHRPELWLDAGFAHAQQRGWENPLYWRGAPGEFQEFTLAGRRELCPADPVCHISYYEADAFARWAGARLPTEQEWEVATLGIEVFGNFSGSRKLHPQPAPGLAPLEQCFGDVWEWTQSSYSAYPGFRADAGALGEYNGKFMSGQMVLRGGSCATPDDHLRGTYRNFFHPSARWQFSGLRLAKDR